ncbi:hypothetical protein BKA69DRAFT_1128541 [Paraphysoderma sedebokerense]|nr:hypothetical protein BKA69DRAFT_1128541 [Paraphysoderma sedebokerense]
MSSFNEFESYNQLMSKLIAVDNLIKRRENIFNKPLNPTPSEQPSSLTFFNRGEPGESHKGGKSGGNYRGNYRGGYSNKGEYRGNYRGGYSNRGSYRGGYSNRGTYRGRNRGSYRGRYNSNGNRGGNASGRGGRPQDGQDGRNAIVCYVCGDNHKAANCPNRFDLRQNKNATHYTDTQQPPVPPPEELQLDDPDTPATYMNVTYNPSD